MQSFDWRCVRDGVFSGQHPVVQCLLEYMGSLQEIREEMRVFLSWLESWKPRDITCVALGGIHFSANRRFCDRRVGFDSFGTSIQNEGDYRYGIWGNLFDRVRIRAMTTDHRGKRTIHNFMYSKQSQEKTPFYFRSPTATFPATQRQTVLYRAHSLPNNPYIHPCRLPPLFHPRAANVQDIHVCPTSREQAAGSYSTNHPTDS